MKKLILFAACLFILVGCGPKLTPLLAERSLEQTAALDHVDSAKVGESLLRGLDVFGFAIYSPTESLDVLAPEGVTLNRLLPEQEWIALFRLDDDTIVVEAPASVTREDLRLGLRLDAAGSVVGFRPWFDLRTKRRLQQPHWGGRYQRLFEVSGMYLVDAFPFDLRYVGKKGKAGVFNYLDYKQDALQPGDYKRIEIMPKESLQLHGLIIRITHVYPDHVRYIVEPVR